MALILAVHGYVDQGTCLGAFYGLSSHCSHEPGISHGETFSLHRGHYALAADLFNVCDIVTSGYI